MKRSIWLVDANNFYWSCQGVFDPTLEGKAGVVASNNDGNAIARSPAAKALGIPMGEPIFKLREQYPDLIVISSNYPLYADMSDRLMNILSSFSPHQEVYSIDESFLDMTGVPGDQIKLGRKVRNRVKKWTGLPVCVGIGESKTLAKLANHCAKKRPEFKGVCNFNDYTAEQLDDLLATIEVDEVWGVGKRLTPKLAQLNILSVLDLKRSAPEAMARQFSVVMERTVRELNGECCIELEEVPPPKKQIVSSRSFGRYVTDMDEMAEAVTSFAARATEKLRAQSSIAGMISVGIHTNPFSKDPPYHKVMSHALPAPTDDTLQLATTAVWLLRQIYRDGFKYQKAEIMLSNIMPAGLQQNDMFGFQQEDTRSPRLMAVLDKINATMGRDTMFLASQGTNRKWKMRQSNLSPCYTTDWGGIIELR